MISVNARTARPLRWLAVAAVLPLAGACTHSDGHGSPVTSTEDGTRAKTSAAQPVASAHCAAAEVRALVGRFVHAFDAGDERALQQVWARRGQGFRWYSTDGPGQRLRGEAKNRAGLGSYFAQRHSAGETLRLTSFQFNGNSAGYGNFQYTLIRSATDLPPTPYIGKGAAICDRMPRTLIVWGMAKGTRRQRTP